MRAAQQRDMQSAGRIGGSDVVGEPSQSSQMMVVFSSRKGLADEWAGLRRGHVAVTGRDCRVPGRNDRIDDVLIPSAPAEVSLEPRADSLFARMRFAAKQLKRAHDHAWGAETALQRVVLSKRGQQAVLAVTGVAQSRDGIDSSTVRLDRQDRA
jgi:hypothetical protein